MPTKAKRKTYNLLMALAILVIIACGIMAVGHLKGWFGAAEGGGADSVSLICRSTTGVVQVERRGVGYTLKEDTKMQDGDTVATKNGSQAVLAWQDTDTLFINEKSELTIETVTADTLTLVLPEGEVFADCKTSAAPVTVQIGGHEAAVKDAVVSVSERSGAGTVCVYAGEADVAMQSGRQMTVAAGEQLLLTENEKGEQVADITKMTASSLSPYIIERLLASPASALCFTADELDQVQDQRAQQKAEADKALEEASIRIAEGEKANVDNSGARDSAGSGSGGEVGSGDVPGAAGGSDGQQGSADGTGGSASGSGASGGQTAGTTGDSGSGSSGSSGAAGDVKTCTITIECSSILSNMGDLKEGKDRYVPANGVILATSAVEFRDGETAYDVTKRACEAMGIQIEASYVPLYESYYVEGINHLYEFDCGGMSGWLYLVNGWTPNYGCSEYVLSDGDSIVWEYTCTGN